jgi:acetyl-CoA carboxylase biotin carboxyl carrier protein
MDDSPSEQDVFDVARILHLVDLMKEHDLSEVDLRQGQMRIRLRRGRKAVVGGDEVAAADNAGNTARGESHPAGKGASGEGGAVGERLAAIASPMVGTFYAAPDAESPPYVKVGDHVGPETTVCIVEAMKILNHIPAEVSGKIVSVLAENGEPVEYGQKMFEVDTRG